MSMNQKPVSMATSLGGAANGTWTDLAGGGRHQLVVSGTIGSPAATLKLQVSHDGGTTPVDMPGMTLTAVGVLEFYSGSGAVYRVVTSGGTGTSLNASAAQIE